MRGEDSNTPSVPPYDERTSELDVPAANANWDGAPSLPVDVLDQQSAREAVEVLRPVIRQKRRELERLQDAYRVLEGWSR